MKLRDTIIFKLTHPIYIRIINTICDIRRKPYIKQIQILFKHFGGGNSLLLNGLSVISSNCFAGRIMQDLKMKYNSPTLGLYFMYPDYIEFLSNLEFYLKEAKIEFVESSKYPLGNQRREACSHWYPIGLLDGKVEIHFLHYHTKEEAAEKWYRRASRVNFDNLLIIGMQQNLCTEQDIITFDSLSFKNKIMFSNIPIKLKSNEYMPEFWNDEYVGDPYRKGHIFYRHLISHFTT